MSCENGNIPVLSNLVFSASFTLFESLFFIGLKKHTCQRSHQFIKLFLIEVFQFYNVMMIGLAVPIPQAEFMSVTGTYQCVCDAATDKFMSLVLRETAV